MWQGEFEFAITLQNQSLRVCKAAGNRRDAGWALEYIGEALAYQGRLREAAETLRTTLQIGIRLGEVLAQVRCLSRLVWVANALGRHSEALGYAELGLHTTYPDGRHSYGRARWLAAKGRALGAIGDYVRAMNCSRRALDAFREEDWPAKAESTALADLALSAHGMTDDAGCRRYAEQIDVAAWQRPPRAAPSPHSFYGWHREVLRIGHALLLAERYVEAESLLRLTLTRLLPTQPDLAVQALAGLAAHSFAQDDLVSARCHADQVVDLVAWHPDLPATEELARAQLVCYRVLAAAGDPHAGDVLADAQRIVEARAAALEDPASRLRFLQNVPVNREIIEAWEAHATTT